MGGRYREAIQLAENFEHVINEVYQNEADAYFFMEAVINRLITDVAFRTQVTKSM